MSKIALVTGSNQGLGHALVKELCATLDSGSTIYLTARSKERGNAAKAEIGNVAPDLRVEQLEVTDDQSVAAIANKIKQYHGGIDIYISNAAARIYKEKTPAEQVRNFINTNNHGTYRVLKSFLPLLKDNARVLIVASAFGSLTHLSEELHSKFDVTSNSLEEIEALMDDYVEAVEQGKAFESGWPEWINVPSKVGQVATAKIASKMISEGRPNDGILINAVCPGLVDTEASRPWFDDMSSAKTPDEAAVDLIWLATLPPGTTNPQGELVQYRRVLP